MIPWKPLRSQFGKASSKPPMPQVLNIEKGSKRIFKKARRGAIESCAQRGNNCSSLQEAK
ncbi:hypothetical protein SESBI_31949, partial [Sesbania bispinosa]